MSTVVSEQPDAPDLPGDMDLEERHALRRVAGLSTELQDISEVEYRALRLERVVLIGVSARSSTGRCGSSGSC
jgi:GTP-binding protein HflX